MLPVPAVVCDCRYFETAQANEYKNAKVGLLKNQSLEKP